MSKKPFNKPPTKQHLRESIGRDVEAYLNKGGDISKVSQGETGLEARTGPLRAPLFTEPKVDRTPVDDVVATLDERRRQSLKRTPSVRRNRKPRRRKSVIYDDFGEALRTVWIED